MNTLVQHHSYPVFLLNRDGRLLECNDTFLQQTGYTLEEVVGMSFTPLFLPEHHERAKRHFDDALNGSVQCFELTGVNHFGQYDQLEMTYVPAIRDGEVVGVYGIAKNLNELRKCEQTLFHHLPDPAFTIDRSGYFASANEAAAELFGFTEEELKHFTYDYFVCSEDLPRTERQFHKALSGQVHKYMIRGTDRYRREKDYEVTHFPIYDDGDIVGVCGIIRDMTELLDAKAKLEESEQRYRSIVELSPDAILISSDYRIVYANDAAAKFFGASRADQLIGQDGLVYVHQSTKQTVQQQYDKVMKSRETTSWFELKVVDLNGRMFDAESIAAPIEVDGRPASLHIIRDISERKKTERRLQHLANHDVLTGLPNRRYFHQLLEERLNNCSSGLFMFIDMDQFKMTNDLFGHVAGDLLLKQVGQRLKSIDPSGIFSRQGGDEFLAFIPNAEGPQCVRILEELLCKLSEPYLVQGKLLTLTPSIGVSKYPEHGEEVEVLLGKADTAMYSAKAKGRNTYILYEENLEKESKQKYWMEGELEKALDEGQLALVYQPTYDLRDRSITGVEALLRWHHPSRVILPSEFIPLAEETRLILPIGEWVLQTACRQLKLWTDLVQSLTISVNISVVQFLQPEFVSMVERVLTETEVEPSQLNLEITESLPMYDFDAAVAKLNELKSLGVKITLDEFGAGFSSFSHLGKLPFDAVKIEQSFVKKLNDDPYHEVIVRSVLSIVHTLQRKVVAEGVEDEATLRKLQALGCEEAQGYILSRPMDSVAMSVLLG